MTSKKFSDLGIYLPSPLARKCHCKVHITFGGKKRARQGPDCLVLVRRRVSKHPTPQTWDQVKKRQQQDVQTIHQANQTSPARYRLLFTTLDRSRTEERRGHPQPKGTKKRGLPCPLTTADCKDENLLLRYTRPKVKPKAQRLGPKALISVKGDG